MDTFEWSSRAREALICAGAALAIDTLASVDHELRRLRTALMSIRDNRLSAADEKALARGLTEANEEIAKLRIEVGELLEGQRAQTDDSYRKGWADAFRAALKARTLQDGHTVALTKVKAT